MSTIKNALRQFLTAMCIMLTIQEVNSFLTAQRLSVPPTTMQRSWLRQIEGNAFLTPSPTAHHAVNPGQMGDFTDTVLIDMTHITLDFPSIFGRQASNQLIAPIITLVGRILVMATDFAPGHTVRTDEFAFQIALFLISCNELCKSVLPFLIASYLSNKHPLSYRDRRAFMKLFDPVGLSLHQYRTLKLSSAFEWAFIEPNKTLTPENKQKDNKNDDDKDDEDDCIYWLYKGDVEVYNSKQKMVQNISSAHYQNKKSTNSVGTGLLFEMHLLAHLVKNQDYEMSTIANDESPFPYYGHKMSVKAGEAGATLLRISTSKLMKIAKTDRQLEESINRLALKGMQDKLNALMLNSLES